MLGAIIRLRHHLRFAIRCAIASAVNQFSINSNCAQRNQSPSFGPNCERRTANGERHVESLPRHTPMSHRAVRRYDIWILSPFLVGVYSVSVFCCHWRRRGQVPLAKCLECVGASPCPGQPKVKPLFMRHVAATMMATATRFNGQLPTVNCQVPSDV